MKKLIPLLMVVLAAVTIAAVYLWQELRDVRTQTGELNAHVAELQSARLAAASAPTMPASPADGLQPVSVTASAGAAPASITGQPAAPASASASAEKKSNNVLQGIAQQMLGTPEGQEIMKAQLRAALPQQYPDLGKELGLSPAETDKLFDMLTKHQMGTTTLGLNLLAGNGSQDPATVQETRRKAQEQQAANQTELATMLGDKMPKYQEYEQTLPMRRQVTQLQATLGSGNNALSDAQGKQLINALAAEQTQIQQDRRNAARQPQQAPASQQAAMEQQLERAAEESNRMVNAARAQLNPQQLDSYRQMLEQQQNMQRTLLRGISSQMGNQGTGSQPAAAAPRP